MHELLSKQAALQLMKSQGKTQGCGSASSQVHSWVSELEAEAVSCVALPVSCVALPVSCVALPVSCVALPVSCVALPVSCVALPVSPVTLPVSGGTVSGSLCVSSDVLPDEGNSSAAE
jgi:hypothetical protein